MLSLALLLGMLVVAQANLFVKMREKLAISTFCGLPIDRQQLRHLISTKYEYNKLLIHEYENLPIHCYPSSTFHSVNAAIKKLYVLFAFINDHESIVCQRLNNPEGYFGMLRERALQSCKSSKVFTKWIFQAFFQDLNFVASLHSIFLEPAMQHFVYPSEWSLGVHWLNYRDEGLDYFPVVIEYAVEFDAKMEGFVAFFGKFYRQVRPTDSHAFHHLLQELGRPFLESRLMQKLLLNSQTGLASLFTDLYFAATRISNRLDASSLIVDFMLHSTVQKHIINEASCLHAILQQPPWPMQPNIADNFEYISEVSIKATMLADFIARPPSDMPSDLRERAELRICFVVALANLRFDPEPIVTFMHQVFELQNDNLAVVKFQKLIAILQPEYEQPLGEVLNYEDIYKINHFRGTIFKVFKYFCYSDTIEMAKAIFRRLNALYRTTNVEQICEPEAQSDLLFSHEQKIMDIKDKFPLESFEDLRQRISHFIGSRSKRQPNGSQYESFKSVLV